MIVYVVYDVSEGDVVVRQSVEILCGWKCSTNLYHTLDLM